MFRKVSKLPLILTTLIISTLYGCNTSVTTEVVGSAAPAPLSVNGIWESRCSFNADTGFYETFDYNITGANARILISSFSDFNCLDVVDTELYEGDVSQNGLVILGNGLDAVSLSFSVFDRDNQLSLNYTSFFDTDPNFLYEYTDTSGNFFFEYQRAF